MDVDHVVVRYPSMFALLADLQSMGESNAVVRRYARGNGSGGVEGVGVGVWRRKPGGIALWLRLRLMLWDAAAGRVRPPSSESALGRDVLLAASAAYRGADHVNGPARTVRDLPPRLMRARPWQPAGWVRCGSGDPAVYGSKEDGSVPATFEILYMIGWKPSPTQPQPLARGSAQTSMKVLEKGFPAPSIAIQDRS